MTPIAQQEELESAEDLGMETFLDIEDDEDEVAQASQMLANELNTEPAGVYRGIVQTIKDAETIEQAYLLMAKSDDATNVADDPSFPSNDEMCRTYVKQMFDAILNVEGTWEQKNADSKKKKIDAISTTGKTDEAASAKESSTTSIAPVPTPAGGSGTVSIAPVAIPAPVATPAPVSGVARRKGKSPAVVDKEPRQTKKPADLTATEMILLNQGSSKEEKLKAITGSQMKDIEVEIMAWKLLVSSRLCVHGFHTRCLNEA